MKPTDDVFRFPKNGKSATPRTDDVLDDNNYFGGSTFIALRNLCRQLERELNVITARAEKAEAELTELRAELIAAYGEQTKVPYIERKAP